MTISSVGSLGVQVTRSGNSAASASATSRRCPSPISRSDAPGTRSATSLQAAARFSRFLYGSSTPTKSARGSAGSSAGGRSANASRSVKAMKAAAGSTPTRAPARSCTRESVRTASAWRSAHGATRSVTGDSARRSGEPYRRGNVRQSPWSSTMSAARERTSPRPASTASASYGLCVVDRVRLEARAARARHGRAGAP